MKALFLMVIFSFGVQAQLSDGSGGSGGSGGGIRPGNPDGTLVSRTRTEQVGRLGCAECRLTNDGVVEWVDGYYRKVAAGLKRSKLPDNSMAITIAPNSTHADSDIGDLGVDVNRLVPDTQPFARPAIITSVKSW